jgi:hypothetical protein
LVFQSLFVVPTLLIPWIDPRIRKISLRFFKVSRKGKSND